MIALRNRGRSNRQAILLSKCSFANALACAITIVHLTNIVRAYQGRCLVAAARRRALFAAVLLSTVHGARAGSVRVQAVENCSQHPRITVLRDGKPMAGVTVEVYRPVDHPTGAHYRDRVGATRRTDAKGQVVLPELPRAIVYVVARWSSGSVTVPDLDADLALRYFPEDPEAESRFTMDLQPCPNGPQFVEQTARDAEDRPIAERVEQFGGTVIDPSGARLRNVSIVVTRLHVAGARTVRKMQTDAEGHFWALLPPGDYVAVFTDPGFQETVHTVTVDPTAPQKEIRVELRVGLATE